MGIAIEKLEDKEFLEVILVILIGIINLIFIFKSAIIIFEDFKFILFTNREKKCTKLVIS